MNTLKSAGWFNLFLTLVSGCATFYLSWTLYTLPVGSVRIPVILPLILFAALFFNRALLIVQRGLLTKASKVIRLSAHAGRWVLTLVLSWGFVAILNLQTNAAELQKIENNFAPLLKFIERSAARQGRPPGDLSNYLNNNPGRLRFSYLYGDDRYMIVTSGGSIDIDGSTVYFNSESKTWARVHNDLLHPQTRNSAALLYQRAKNTLKAITYP